VTKNYQNIETLNKTSWKRVCDFVLIGAPILFYYFCIFIFAVNIPFWDDYDSLRQHIAISSSDSLQERISILFSQHNEHRIAFNRIVFVLYDFLFQEINFKFLPLIGNSALLILFLFFYKSFSSAKDKPILLVPIAWTLFQLENWRNMTWTLASLSNLYVLCFAGISFYFLSMEKISRFYLGVLFAIFAVFTQGSGIGVFPIFWCFLLAVKKYKESFYWLAVFIIIASIYFIGYEKPINHPSIWTALSNQTQLWGYFFLFLGGALFFSKNCALILGFCFFAFFIFLTIRKYYLEKPSLYLFISFLILVSAIAALTRSGYGMDQALVPRYKIISILLTISFYIVVADWFYTYKSRVKPFLVSSILFSMIFYSFSFQIGLESLTFHRFQMITGIIEWPKSNKGLSYPQPDDASETLSLAVKKGVFRLRNYHK
jgi:hypothetical protein